MANFVITSDQHCHGWTAFSHTRADGVNSRLQDTLNELERAAAVALNGSKRLVFAGDLFHTRGSIDPEVFNPVHKTIVDILKSGVRIDAIPGNHDLKSNKTREVSNAIQTFGELDGFTVYTKPTIQEGVLFVPWMPDHNELVTLLEKIADKRDVSDIDVVCHVGINGVIPGLPDNSVNAETLSAIGFKRVFAGHYHSHKVMCRGTVYSIGALTHQTWGDVNSRAGFLEVESSDVKFRATNAPRFVQIDRGTDLSMVLDIADGNYVRVTDMKLSDIEMIEMEKNLKENGAKGVLFQIPKDLIPVRTTKGARSATIGESVSKYIDNNFMYNLSEIKASCADILSMHGVTM